MVYTLPQAIKREKKMKKGLAILNQKERRLAKLKVKKRNERGSSEGLVFLFFFYFMSKGVTRENILTGEGGFFFS